MTMNLNTEQIINAINNGDVNIFGGIYFHDEKNEAPLNVKKHGAPLEVSGNMDFLLSQEHILSIDFKINSYEPKTGKINEYTAWFNPWRHVAKGDDTLNIEDDGEALEALWDLANVESCLRESLTKKTAAA